MASKRKTRSVENVASDNKSAEKGAELVAGGRKSSPTPFECDICNKSYNIRPSLKKHILRKHHGLTQHICRFCSKIFMDVNNLVEHVYSHLFVCDICNISFKTQSLLSRHHNMHTGDEPYTCKVCSTNFTSYSELRNHLFLRHSNIKLIHGEKCSENSSDVSSSPKQTADEVISSSVQTCSDSQLSVEDEDVESCIADSPSSVTEESNKSVDVDASTSNQQVDNEASLELKPKKFSCEECGKCLSSKFSLQNHKRTHGIGRTFACTVCGVKQSKYRSLRQHYLSKHPDVEPFKCDACNLTFYDVKSFESHKVKHKAMCDMCGRYFLNESLMLKHVYDEHSVEKHFQCHLCKASYKTYSTLKSHILNFHPNAKPLICKLCNEAVLDSYTFNRHMKSHHVNQNEDDVRKTELSLISVIDDLNNLDEPVAKSAVVLTDLGANQDNVTSFETTGDDTCTVGNLFKCSLCKETFKEKIDLETHWKVHTKTQHFVCDVCGSVCNGHTNFKFHKLIHSEEKPFECNVCFSKFRQRGNLTVHMRTHNTEKPYQCDVCGERLRWRKSVKRHELMHSGEKPYKCQFCVKRFRSSSERLDHTRRHTGDRRFKCDYCDKAFIEKNELKRHYFVHSGNKPIMCDVCGKRFVRRYDLKVHMKTHSKIMDHPSEAVVDSSSINVSDALNSVQPCLETGNIILDNNEIKYFV